MKSKLSCLLASAALSLAPAEMHAQEISFQAGGSHLEHAESYSWQAEFRHEFARNIAWSASWINEGHAITHHRDGVAAQMWIGRTPPLDGFAAALGLGGYYYNNTILLPGGVTVNSHGVTPIYSLSGTYAFKSPWFIRATFNYITTADNHAGNTFAAGVGYRLGATPFDPTGRSAPSPPKSTGAELTFLLGRSIENNALSENATAESVEYRRGIGRNFEWTLTWLNEGDPHIIRRSGIATQVWIAEAFPRERLILGLGVGPYFFSHARRPPAAPNDNREGLAVLVSPTISFRLNDRWHLRFTWERVISKDDRDADVFLLGSGYRWANLW